MLLKERVGSTPIPTTMIGIIIKDKDRIKVLGDDGRKYELSWRLDGVLVNSKKFNGKGSFSRQDPNLLLNQKVEFVISPTGYGYNYEIII